jgi:hypothetical protein
MDLLNCYKKVVELAFTSTSGKMKSFFFHTVLKVRCNQLFLSTFISTMFIAIIGFSAYTSMGVPHAQT